MTVEEAAKWMMLAILFFGVVAIAGFASFLWIGVLKDFKAMKEKV